MTSDIVARLRYRAKWFDEVRFGEEIKLLCEAANEIERLRAELPPDLCAVCGQPLTWAHDHRDDLSGLDDGPPLPKRKKAAPKPADETARIRAEAWATRRARYGQRGHKGSYSS